MSISLRWIVRHLDRLIGGGLFLLALGLYLRTLAPSVAALFDDTLEFQLVCPTLGIAHPTGYPLYTLLGWLFTLIPLGDAAYRVNLVSAIFGATTVALVYPLVKMLAPPGERATWSRLAAVLAPLTSLAFSPAFWSQATVAEVYTLNSTFIALILLLSLTATKNQPPTTRNLYLLAVTYGLSLTHHRTMLLLAPAILLHLALTLGRNKRWATHRAQYVLRSLFLFLAPLLLYLYIPLRGMVTTSLDGTYENSLAGFWRQVTASGYSIFLGDNPLAGAHPPDFYFRLFLVQIGPIGLILGAFGLIALLRKPRELALTGVAFLCYTAFGILYHVPDVEVFFIPSFLIYTLWVGTGIAFALNVLERGVVGVVRAMQVSPVLFHRGQGQWALSSESPLLPWAVALVIVALCLVPAWSGFRERFPGQDRSRAWDAYDYGLDVLSQPLEREAAIVGILGEMTLLRYFQQTQGLRPDIITVAADDEELRLARVERLLSEGRAVYLTRTLPGAPQRWSLSALGPLIRVQTNLATSLPPTVRPVLLNITPALRLAGYHVVEQPFQAARGWRLADSLSPVPPPAPARVRLTLYWQALSAIEADYKVSARLLRGEQMIAQTDAVPVHFAYPTTAWRAGELVTDTYDLRLASYDDSGLTILVIVYDPTSLEEVGRANLGPMDR